jgi:hypothetical protein
MKNKILLLAAAFALTPAAAFAQGAGSSSGMAGSTSGSGSATAGSHGSSMNCMKGSSKSSANGTMNNNGMNGANGMNANGMSANCDPAAKESSNSTGNKPSVAAGASGQ